MSIKRNLTSLFGVTLWKLLITYSLLAFLSHEHKPWNVCLEMRSNLCGSNENQTNNNENQAMRLSDRESLPFYSLFILLSRSL